jgi:hypothetical protein
MTEGFVPRAAWDAAVDPSLPEGTAEVNGQRIVWDEASNPAGTFLVPQALLEDYGDAGWLGDWLGKALRGEVEPRPPLEPKRHRCLACWLVSLLPGHDRCSHGYAESGCETCGEW